MKSTKILVLATILALGSTAAWGQGRIEISPFVGYRTTGVIDGTTAAYSEFHIEDGLSYGLTLGYRLNPRFTLEARWSRSDSTVTAHGLNFAKTTLADVSTDTYHANFLFYWRGEEYKVRPYFMFGLGAITANARNVGVGDVNPDAEWRFSWNMGLGMQAQLREKIGLKLQAIWLPTYINSSSGWWYDWWGNVWLVPIANYMHQFEFTAALVFRF